MNNIAKKPYKITLWEDKNVYIVGGQRKYIVDENDVVQNQFLEENCIAIIGSNTMDTPIRAVNPVLTEDLNGSKTLTFQIYMRYWDDEEEDWKPNPFINLLVNERRVKLKYGNDEWVQNEDKWEWDEQDPWIDFVIKQVTEDSEGETISVTCKDLFINELGKTGYEVELDTELQNNMGTVTELAEKILENTDWRVGDSEHLFQRHKEALFEYIVEDGFFSQIEELTVQPFESEKIHRDIIASNLVGKKIYIFYSCVSEKEDKVQFLYEVNSYNGGPNDGKPIVDEYGFIRKTIKVEDNSGNEIEEDVYYEATFNSEGEGKDAFYGQFYNNYGQANELLDGSSISNYFGEKLVQKQKSKYFPQIGETCYLYEDEEHNKYWCYTNSEYLSSSEIQNLLSNTNNFTSTDSWKVDDENNANETELIISESNREYTPGEPVTVNVHGETMVYKDRIVIAKEKGWTPHWVQSSVNQASSNNAPTTFSLKKGGGNKSNNGNNSNHQIILDNYGPLALLSSFSPRGLVQNEEYILGAKIVARDNNGNEINNYQSISDEKVVNPKLQSLYKIQDNKYILAEEETPGSGITYYTNNIFPLVFDFIGLGADKWEETTDTSIQEIYKIITPSSNPKDEGLYEKNNDNYILTTDTEISENKDYYKKKNKTYYCLNEKTGDYDLVSSPDPSLNPQDKGLYEKKYVSLLDFHDGELIENSDLLQGEFVCYSQDGQRNNRPEYEGYTFVKSNYGLVPTGDSNGTISYAEMCKIHGNMRLNSRANSNVKQLEITDIKLFPAQTTEDESKYFVPDSKDGLNENLNDAIIKIRYNFFPAVPGDTNLDSVYGKEDLHLSASIVLPLNGSITEKGYNPIMVDDYGKVTSITGSKSNRFNLIQMLCEAFECWAKFDIEHDETGRILYEYKQDEDLEPGDWYYKRIDSSNTNFSDDTNFENADLNDLYELVDDSEPFDDDWYEYDEGSEIYKHTKDNEKISGKQYYRKNTSLYKRTYHKYVTFKEFIGDDNPVGFRYGINLKSIERNIVSDQIATKVIVQPNSNEFAPNGSCTIQQSALNPTGENALYNFQFFINHELIDIQSLYDDLYGRHGGMGFFTKLKQWNNDITDPINNLATINNAICNLESKQTVYDTAIDEANKKISKLQTEIQGAGGTENSYVAGKKTEQDTLYSSIHNYESLSSSNKRLLDKYQEQSRQISNKLKEIENKKKRLNADFHRKYFRFIQEGTWTSEDYYDPELYFQAANEVLYTSAFPQISYTINVLELSQLEGFEPYTFKIADKTYIEDTEFFGYDYQGRPYKEEIVVSQIVSNLDDPSLNTITVQNYKTQFQDLFQRIAAASQSLQYAEGEYKRASGAVNPDGTINSSLMQNSLMDNELIIKNAKNQAVTWDETGISISNFKDAANVVRLTSDGIVLTNDGGLTWTTGITGSGINASVITTGRLDTDRIRIFSDGMQTFEWNGDGLSAFVREPNIGTGNGINYNKYVRFDQYGIYGYNGDYNSSGVPDKFKDIDEVISNSIFSLTWKGLALKSEDSSGNYLKLSAEGEAGPGEKTKIIWAGSGDEDKFYVTRDGALYASDGYFEGEITGSEIHIGPYEEDGTTKYYFEVDRNGHITGLTTYSNKNNSNGTIISSTTSSSGGTTTTTSKFDITCAEGDFSGTFSGLINTDQINLYEKQTSWSNIGVRKNPTNQNIYEIYNKTTDEMIPPGGYMVLNAASSANYALEIHSNGAGRFQAEAGNIFISTKNSNYPDSNDPNAPEFYYLMLTSDGKIQTNCSTIQTGTGEAGPTGSATGGTTLDNTAVFG